MCRSHGAERSSDTFGTNIQLDGREVVVRGIQVETDPKDPTILDILLVTSVGIEPDISELRAR